MVVRVELRGKNLRTARVTGVSQRFIQRRARSDFTHFEQVGPQLNRHTRYRPATTTRNTATQRSRRSIT